MDQERAWIEQALQGDRAAFGQLVKAYERPVYNLTYRMLGNAAEAEDAAQETFLRAYKKLATYQPERKFVNWVLSIPGRRSELEIASKVAKEFRPVLDASFSIRSCPRSWASITM